MSNSLPIDAIKHSLFAALQSYHTYVLCAPPGAGKSTRLPLWLISEWLLADNDLSDQKIYLLQPRRLAVKNIAHYLAKQLNQKVGETVGYRLRNETRVSSSTKLEVITEGILTQIIQQDPELTDCALVILDEFHERSLQGDLAFALARDVQQSLREDLKILIMSATLNSEQLLQHLPDAIALESKGRSFPVDVSYQPPSSSREWRQHALKVLKTISLEHKGSILVFLSGTADIHFLVKNLSQYLPSTTLLCPLYGALSLKEQQQAIEPAAQGMNKIVLATNIAETSLTIEGINLVVDCGYEKVAVFDQQTLTNRLQQQVIAKASAIQRAGRAGRIMAGQCIRIYSKEDFERRQAHNISEIQQADLSPLLIEAARWGVTNLKELPLIELPENTKEKQAWQTLQQLALLDNNRRLTLHGQQVSSLACHPRFAHMIVKAQQLENSDEIEINSENKGLTSLACILAALLEERDIFSHEQAKFDCDLRHRVLAVTSTNKGQSPHIKTIIQQAQRLSKQLTNNQYASHTLPIEHTGTLLALAYPERITKARGNFSQYLAANGKGLTIESEDALATEPYLVVAQTSQYQQQLNIRLAAPVDFITLQAWKLISLTNKQDIRYDEQKDRIIASNKTFLSAILIKEEVTHGVLSKEQISEMWADKIQNTGLQFLPLKDHDKALLLRWRWLNLHQNHLNLPDVSEPELLAQLAKWFTPFVGDIKSKGQLKKCHFSDMFLSMLNYNQQKLLLNMAPEYFQGPTGRKCSIRYNDEVSPTVSLPMQELYGTKLTPSVGDVNANKGIPLLLELLSPAGRPIQITQNLILFWQGSYKEVQKDMKAKHPKHFWPDDPENAKPTNKTKRHLKHN